MIEAFNLDLLDDLWRRQPTLHRSEGKRIRRRVGETLIAVGRWLDPELATTRRRAVSDCA